MRVEGIAGPEPDRGPKGLTGIRVLERAGGVGVAWAAKLFADLGADVIRFENDHDRVRLRPHNIHQWLNTNKRSSTTGFEALANDADLVIHDGDLEADLMDQLPGSAVVLALSPFGLSGPYAQYVAEEINVIHGSSWGFLSPAGAVDVELPPLKAPGHHATINTATMAATVALAALDRAQRRGVGEYIDFSTWAAAAKITEFAPAIVSFLDHDASRLGGRTVVPWGIYRCADGLMQLISPEQHQWEALVELMGRPEWATMDIVATGPGRSENADLVDLYLGQWMATQTVDELYHAAQAAGIAMTPVNTMAQLDANPHLEQRGFFARTPAGLRLPGPGYQLDQAWWELRSDAPAAGANNGETWHLPGFAAPIGRSAPLPEESKAEDSPTTESNAEELRARPARGELSAERPLAGVRVCDFTWIWAGPTCTQLLAHLGADVIKLESPEHLGMFRRLPFSPSDGPTTVDTSGAFQLYNTDKRSVGIDLAHPDSAEVVSRLVAVSDVVVDNFGLGTMARLGYGVNDLRRINPEVIVASLTGYGQTGPASQYMAYGPAGGALAGLYASNGYEGGGARETGIAIGDPATGITAAWAIVAALFARRRGAAAARVDVAMVEAIAATVGEGWMSYQAEGRSPQPAGNHDPLWAPHNCYPSAGADNWVTIACTDEASWAALCGVVDGADGALRLDPRFATAQLRRSNEAALDAVVSAWTSTRDRWEITHLLQAASVAAFPSLSPAELWRGDPQLQALGMIERPVHPATGERAVPGVPWRLANAPNGLQRPSPMLGQHTEEVLTGLLGYTTDEITTLTGRGVVMP